MVWSLPMPHPCFVGRYMRPTLHTFPCTSELLASSALRTMTTAARVVAQPPPVAVDDLYFVRPWRTAEMAAADRATGYAPVATYIANYPGVYDAVRCRAKPARRRPA